MAIMQKHFEVRFECPAFLGNASQSGQWRTPPFKAQLRQWWRMVWAKEWLDKQGYPSDQRNRERMYLNLRREEGLLFGNAWLENEYRKSLVRMRLDRWDEGKLRKAQWPAEINVTHPEVPRPVGSALYLGYGPLVYDNQRRATTLKANAAIQAGETATLLLAMPEVHASLVECALWLMDRYGTVGGRSRSGWGSYALLPENSKSTLQGSPPLRPWRDCLNLDWPHAIGSDEKGALIWQTVPHDDWRALMRTLAQIKIGLRTQFRFTTGNNAPRAEERHWLAYPVTRHAVAGWGNLRLPNQLRFKVRATEGNKLIGVIFHVPHLPPAAFNPNLRVIQTVWQRVHVFLDDPAQRLTRISV